MIQSFADAESERFYTTGKSRRIPTEIRARAAKRLTHERGNSHRGFAVATVQPVGGVEA